YGRRDFSERRPRSFAAVRILGTDQQRLSRAAQMFLLGGSAGTVLRRKLTDIHGPHSIQYTHPGQKLLAGHDLQAGAFALGGGRKWREHKYGIHFALIL